MRVANLVSLLRGTPYTYSVRALKDSTALCLPASNILGKLRQNTELNSYLSLVTENSKVRKISKDMNEAGCSQLFKVTLLGRSKYLELPSSSWIKPIDKSAKFVFYLFKGEVQVFQRSQGNKVKM
jgi:CRP-like cAMP-binding protein